MLVCLLCRRAADRYPPTALLLRRRARSSSSRAENWLRYHRSCELRAESIGLSSWEPHGGLTTVLPEEIPTSQCPECGHSLHWPVAGVPQPEAGEPSVCVHCGALTIFTDKLEVRLLDWPDWRLLTHAKKKDLVATRAVILARIRAAKQ